MKDAKGHGSNPHGAHAGGIDKVGAQPPLVVRAGGAMSELDRTPGYHAISDRQSYQVLPSELPGLSYVKYRNTGYKGYTLYHDGTGKIMGDWDAQKGVKDKDFTSQVDERLKPLGIDWTIKDENKLQAHPNFNLTTLGRALQGKGRHG